jgi:acetolactate synthase-1/2/3 large subunit
MIKVSNYIAKKLKEYGIKHIFMISGGGAMHLNDSFGSSFEYICNHHEQASAIAAEGYARISGQLAVVNVTTGPGGINTLNGVFGQFTDSVPILYISGQVKYETTLASHPHLALRQLGDQEADIISIVKPITKYAKMVKNPADIGKILAKAIDIATSKRPGPVWLDIPINVQAAMIEEDDLEKYKRDEKANFNEDLDLKIEQLISYLLSAKRPVIIAGHGIRISKSVKEFLNIIKQINIPILSTFNGCDLIASDHPLYIGRIGTLGQRAGNFALQNADLVLFLGTRNNIRQISYNFENFANKAKKIIVDIDQAELIKPTIKGDLLIKADLKDFFKVFNSHIVSIKSSFQLASLKEWLNWCILRKEKYHPSAIKQYYDSNGLINPYYFSLALSKVAKEDSIIITANATASICIWQAFMVKNNQRIIWNSGNASMGYDLPAAIGACLGGDKKEVICLAGDGSIMMNLQELQTIKHYNLPIKIFVLNNCGYSSIKQTQNNFFAGRIVAADATSGVTTPDFIEIAKAFKLPAVRISQQENLAEEIAKILAVKGPILCEIMLDSNCIFQPKLSSKKLPDGKMISKPLEDMYPFLPREEFEDNIL